MNRFPIRTDRKRRINICLYIIRLFKKFLKVHLTKFAVKLQHFFSKNPTPNVIQSCYQIINFLA